MDVQKKMQLQRLGFGIAFLGLGSIILAFLDYNFIVLAWMNLFGDTAAWIIRIVLVLIGGIIYFKYDVADDELNFEDEEEDDLLA